jgi:hypothetical protein
MELEAIKEAYKNSINEEKMDAADYEQMMEEIDEADQLDEFIDVVKLWATPKTGENVEHLILRRMSNEFDYNSQRNIPDKLLRESKRKKKV